MDGVVVDVDDRAIAMAVMELIPDATLDANGFLQVRDEAEGAQPAANEAPGGDGGLAEVYAFLSERMRPEDMSRLREEEEAAVRSASRRATSMFAQNRSRTAEGWRRRLSAGSPGGGQEQERPLFAGSDGGYGYEDDSVPIFPFLTASSAAIAGLEKATYSGDGSGSGDAGGTSADCTFCAICIEDYEAGDELSVMPCAGRHRFHRKCVGEWLSQSRLCPLCRHELPAEKSKVDPMRVTLALF